nr:urease accessory UreF family protein [Clostridia bacterium]
SESLCQHFLKAQSALSEHPLLRAYQEAIQDGRCDGHYSVALGLFIRSLGAPLVPSLQMVGYGLLSAMANHAVKLIPLRQMDGQSALYAAIQGIPAAVHRALRVSADELGVSGCGFDLRAMQHETLPGRLYIS